MDPITLAIRFVDALPDAAIILDTQLKPLHYNALYLQMTGQRASRLRGLFEGGTTPFDILAVDSSADLANAQQAVASGRVFSLAEVEVRNTLGQAFVVLQTFVPLLTPEGKCVGVTELLRDMSGESRIYARFKEMLAREKSRAEELERMVEERTRQLTEALDEVTRLSRTDALTGVLNRRAFTEFAEQALKLAQRYGRTAAVLMCDLDYFKRVNDTYGHQAGDAILIASSKALQNVIRTTDKIARFGGEEFVLLLTETLPEAVPSIAERCRKLIEQIPTTSVVPGMPGPQTVSIGMAIFPAHGNSMDQLIANADTALYQAKRAGRNRAICYTPELELQGEATHITAGQANQPRVLYVAQEGPQLAADVAQLTGAYQVLTATGIKDAISLISSHSVDVLVADHNLAESAVELLRRSVGIAPATWRTLIVPDQSTFVALRGANLGRADMFVVRAEASSALSAALDYGLLRKKLRETRISKSGEFGVLASHQQIQAFEQLMAKPCFSVSAYAVTDQKTKAIVGYDVMCVPQDTSVLHPTILYEVAVHVGRAWELGRLMRQAVARCLPELSAKGPFPWIWVRLHSHDLSDPTLLEGDPALLADANRIILELPERSAVPNMGLFLERIETLRSHGFRIALDDAGPGYAQLSLIQLVAPYLLRVDVASIPQTTPTTVAAPLLQHWLALAAAQQPQRPPTQLVGAAAAESPLAEALQLVGCPYFRAATAAFEQAITI